VLSGVFARVQEGRLARRNPVCKLLSAVLLTLVLVVSLDVVTPLLVLLATLLAIPWSGVRGVAAGSHGRPAAAVGCDGGAHQRRLQRDEDR
jgi:hypothetical protein